MPAREVFKAALLANAHSLILSHNHPSGSIQPSDQDIRLTRALVSVGEVHRTERMRDLYSSVSAVEQRDGIGKVLDLAGAGIPSDPGAANGMHCGMHPPEVVCNPAGANARCV